MSSPVVFWRADVMFELLHHFMVLFLSSGIWRQHVKVRKVTIITRISMLALEQDQRLRLMADRNIQVGITGFLQLRKHGGHRGRKLAWKGKTGRSSGAFWTNSLNIHIGGNEISGVRSKLDFSPELWEAVERGCCFLCSQSVRWGSPCGDLAHNSPFLIGDLDPTLNNPPRKSEQTQQSASVPDLDLAK